MSGRSVIAVRRSVLAACAISALVAAIVLSACGTRAPGADTSRLPGAVTVAGSPSSTIDPRILAADTAVMVAYNGYINAETAASQTANYSSGDLAKYMSDPLLGTWISNLFNLHSMGDIQRGAVVTNPVMVSLKLAKSSGTAIVRDCLDQSGIKIVNKKTGKIVPIPTGKPFVTTATVLLYPDGRWLVSKVDAKEDGSC